MGSILGKKYENYFHGKRPQTVWEGKRRLHYNMDDDVYDEIDDDDDDDDDEDERKMMKWMEEDDEVDGGR